MQNIPLVLFGVPFHNVTFEEAIQWTVDRVRSGRPGVIATANLDFLVLVQNDPELRDVLREADLVIADGFPIVKLAPFYGPALKERVTGSDITPMLAARNHGSCRNSESSRRGEAGHSLHSVRCAEAG